MGPIRGFRGEQVGETHSGYDETRATFNAMVDRRPALIARCTSSDDVALTIAHARRSGLPLAVRAGGHSVAGLCLNDGGVVVDVRPMAEVTVDPQRRIARCGAGATWAEFDRGTQAHGTGDDRRARVEHRSGRADAGRRLGLARAPPRTLLRQPRGRRDGHGRRRDRPRER